MTVYLLDGDLDRAKRINLLRKWHITGGVLIIGFETFKILCMKRHQLKPKLLQLEPHRLRARVQQEVDPALVEQAESMAFAAQQPPTEALISLSLEVSDEICGYLQRPGPEMMIVDEVHTLKDTKQDLPSALRGVRTKRRVGLTGTPFQNNLSEYFAMLDFVRPGCLGERHSFLQHYVSPIEAGQHSDSTREDVNRMRR